MCLYKNISSLLTLFITIQDKVSTEEPMKITDLPLTTPYVQVVRDYVYCRESGMRISIERRFHEYLDTDTYRMDYDCFNRYKFDCYIHIEWEYESNMAADRFDYFTQKLCHDPLVFELLSIVSEKNLNVVSDELINIQHMTLMHSYGYGDNVTSFRYYSLKYDGVRENFSIYGKYFQIGGKCWSFDSHWFGQVIVGHCEILPSGEIILIDIYLIAENFQQIAKKYNISYTNALQNYHKFYSNQNGGQKTQDEYFHMTRLAATNVKFMNPIEAIKSIQMLQYVWAFEPQISNAIELQQFYKTFKDVTAVQETCSRPIDGCLGYSRSKIFKIKKCITIDLVWKFDEMFRSIYKRMKANNHDLKKIVQVKNIQKTLDWIEFENCYPGKFNRFTLEFLFFAQNKNFQQHYNDWSVYIDVRNFVCQLQTQDKSSTSSVLLAEFDVRPTERQLVFTRLRNDKFAANSITVFEQILKQGI